MLGIRAEIHEMLVRIVNRNIADQTASSKDKTSNYDTFSQGLLNSTCKVIFL